MSEAKQPTAVPCKSCRAPMFWAVTADKKKCPFNAEADPVGGFVLTLKSDGTLFAEVYVPAQHYDRRRWTSHFATCPDRDHWRKNG